MILFLSLFAIYLAFKDKDTGFLLAILVAVISAVVIESVSYLIPDAKRQDTLSLEAYCNISGALKKEIKVS